MCVAKCTFSLCVNEKMPLFFFLSLIQFPLDGNPEKDSLTIKDFFVLRSNKAYNTSGLFSCFKDL